MRINLYLSASLEILVHNSLNCLKIQKPYF
nr:MAG TPA: hypothetical protein [Caudoviricetes sp.]